MKLLLILAIISRICKTAKRERDTNVRWDRQCCKQTSERRKKESETTHARMHADNLLLLRFHFNDSSDRNSFHFRFDFICCDINAFTIQKFCTCFGIPALLFSFFFVFNQIIAYTFFGHVDLHLYACRFSLHINAYTSKT